MKIFNILVAIIVLIAGIGMATSQVAFQRMSFDGIASTNMGIDTPCHISYDIGPDGTIRDGGFSLTPICPTNYPKYKIPEYGSFDGNIGGKVGYDGHIMICDAVVNGGGADFGTLVFSTEGPDQFVVVIRSGTMLVDTPMRFTGNPDYDANRE